MCHNVRVPSETTQTTAPSDTADASPHRGRPGHTREDVIEAAVDLFTRHGYYATSMGQVADSLGISKAALYHHISSKEQILELTVDHALNSLDEAFSRVEKSDATPGEKLRAVIHDTVVILCDDPSSVALLLRMRGVSDVELAAKARRRELTDRLVPIVADAIQAGEIRSDVAPEVLTRLIFGTINAVSSWYDTDGVLDSESTSALVTDLIFTGIVA